MTCTPRLESFRLLDARTGWEVQNSTALGGFDDPVGLRLGPRVSFPGAAHVADVYRCLYPARVAIDSSGRVLHAAPSGLRVLDVGSGRWSDVALPDEPVSISALSWGRGLLAVADGGARRVDVLRGTPLREVLRIDLVGLVGGRPRLVALTPWSLLAIVTEEPPEIVLVGMDGVVRARRSCPEATEAAELGMACVQTNVGDRSELLLAVRVELGWRRLLRVDRDTAATSPVPASVLRCSPSASVRIEAGDDETWRVEPSHDPPVPPALRYVEHGELCTLALDSGLKDCEWHRVRMDAEQPLGTRINVRLATLTEPSASPEVGSWQTLPPGATDALLVGQPRGRYLRLQLELVGDGQATPVIRSVRADFDVPTSLDRLPAFYRSDPQAAEFTGRFLSLFDASFGQLDDVIDAAPLLFDARRLPDHVLPALAVRVGIRADPSWSPDRLRKLLAAWPEIFPLIGTPQGLRRLVATVYGIDVLVEELGRARPWAAAGQARLGEVRLFGLARASFRLGTGTLGESLMEPSADPLAPAYGNGAYRCVVHVPARLAASQRPALEALIRAHLPVHVSVRVRYASQVLRVGRPLAVGVATRIGRLAAGVLGDSDRAVVLGRSGPLAAACGGGAPVTVGRRSIAGITT